MADGAVKLDIKQEYNAKQPVPEGASVSLSLPKTVAIGDSIIGRFIVKNTGAVPFEIGTGGDYRGASVPLRLKVRVTDARGLVLPDLAKHENCFGGLMGGNKLAPGESHSIECPLQGYVTFVEPGVYTVEACHDLGWLVQDARPHPVATTKIEVTLPSQDQAAALVRGLCAKDDSETKWQLSKLQHPIFLASLLDEARTGRAVASIGLENIASVETNEALLALVKEAVPDVAKAAASAMTSRLPSLVDATKPAWHSFFNRTPRTDIFKCWQPRFDAPLMEAAHGMLAQKDAALVGLGASFIEARGSPDQSKHLLKALQLALDVYREPRSGPKANVLDQPEPIRQLLRAVDALRERGWRINYEGGGTAEMIAHYRQIADPKIPHAPMDREQRESATVWMENGPTALRESVIRAIRVPFGEEWDKSLLKAMNDCAVVDSGF